MSDLRRKAIHGLKWNFLSRLCEQGVHFVLGILIARYLNAEEYGLFAIIAVFVALSQALVDGGMSQALIQKKDSDESDATTMFVLNLCVSLLIAGVLCAIAPWVATFYERPILQSMMYCLAAIPVIDAFGRVQQALLTKNLRFDVQLIVQGTATLISGVVGLIMAINQWGVWSLVATAIISATLQSILLWLFYGWRPRGGFRWKSAREMSRFGLPLMGAGMLDTLFINIYSIIIPKLYSPTDLGFFTRARKLQQLPARNLTQTIGKVSFPVFAEIQDQDARLRKAVRKSVVTLSFVVFPTVIWLTAAADVVVEVLLTAKWLGCVAYLRLLCVAEMLFPLQVVNLNVLKARGKSGLFFGIDVLKKSLTVVSILITFRWGVSGLIIGQMCVAIIAYFLNSYYTSQTIRYSAWQQLADVAPNLGVSLVMGAVVIGIGQLSIESKLLVLLLQMAAGAAVYLGLTAALRLEAFSELWLTLTQRRRQASPQETT